MPACPAAPPSRVVKSLRAAPWSVLAVDTVPDLCLDSWTRLRDPAMGGHQFRRRANNHAVLLAAITCAASFGLLTSTQAQMLVPRGSEQPSFDCSKARTAAARLICADGELARLDGELGTAFQNRKAQLSPTDASAFVADELAWIRDRNTRCDLVGKNDAAIDLLTTSKSCLASAIQQRITSFLQSESASGTAPSAQQEPMALIPPSSAQPATRAADEQAAPTQHHAAHSEVDVLLRAVGFALTGSDDANPSIIGNRANCVFAIGNEVYHLNNVHTDRITIQGWQQKTLYSPTGLAKWVTVELHGDDVVFEEMTERREPLHLVPVAPHNTDPTVASESSKEHELKLNTDDQDRVKRAWQYIYSHGCIGKQSPF
jgi:uncharacterized protein